MLYFLIFNITVIALVFVRVLILNKNRDTAQSYRHENTSENGPVRVTRRVEVVNQDYHGRYSNSFWD